MGIPSMKDSPWNQNGGQNRYIDRSAHRHIGIGPAAQRQRHFVRPCHTPSPSPSENNLNHHRGRFNKGHRVAHGRLAIFIERYYAPAPVCRPWIEIAECMPKLLPVTTTGNIFKELEMGQSPFLKR
jgi:hypothetical protein